MLELRFDEPVDDLERLDAVRSRSIDRVQLLRRWARLSDLRERR
jgi:hypothetical protein